jgi:hypothetical protein
VIIDDFSDDDTGWARFSSDRTMRYRLARSLTGDPLSVVNQRWANLERSSTFSPAKRCVFLMLNPSKADAFKLDPTVQRCMSFALREGAELLEVVNLFALRSTDPDELYKYAHGSRGDDATNDREIIDACDDAHRVVIAWGKHGALGGRSARVLELLGSRELHYLKRNKDGSPVHPLYQPTARPFEVWT